MLKISNSGEANSGAANVSAANSGAAGKTVIHLDKYSKTVLTVIASCLVLIAVNLYFSPKDSSAYEQVQDVNIRSINGSSISGGYLPVDLVRIDGSSSKEIRVDLRSINGRSVFGDKVPVDIQGVNGQFFIGGDLPVRVR